MSAEREIKTSLLLLLQVLKRKRGAKGYLAGAKQPQSSAFAVAVWVAAGGELLVI